jgi:hypothetical protein
MPRLTNHLGKSLLFALACAAAISTFAAPDTNSVFSKRAEAEFQRTKQLYWTNANNPSNAWVFASACYDLTEFAPTEARRGEIAKQGIAACQQLVTRDPKSAAGHYYLAMNYGELAEAEAPSLAAYRLVHEVEREFKTAETLDEKVDFAGPVRCLGLLYRDAPGWPLSIGSKWKAREQLERADKLAPGYPENQLNLVESFLQWRDSDEAEKSLKKLDTTWNAARTNLTGVAWEKSWHDWAVRRTAAKAEFQKLFKRVPGT